MKKRIKQFLSGMSPELTTWLLYYNSFKRPLNLKNPKTFNEKIQYLKLKNYYHNPIITQCVDKWRVREYVMDHVPELQLPKLYFGGIMDPEEIRHCWSKLPKSFVIKCNHGAGYNILVPNKDQIDVDTVVIQLSQWMKEDYWKIYCEPQYQHVKPCILIEEYLGSETGDCPVDYKCYCFNGKCELIMACLERDCGDVKFLFFDREWNLQMLTQESYNYLEMPIERPAVLENAIAYAEALSKEFPFVRVDLYVIGDKVYLGEMTFVPSGGLDKDFNFVSSDKKYGGKSTDVVLGEMLQI